MDNAQEKYRKNNPEKIREAQKRYYNKNKQKVLDRQAKLRSKDKTDQNKNSYYKYHYKITYDQYLDLLKKQEGVCAICKKEEFILNSKGNIASLCVDHCHTTGKVRGLLCRECNSGLGKFKDNLSLVLSAAAYLNNDSI